MIAFGDVILFQNHREGHRPSPTMAYGIRCFKLQFNTRRRLDGGGFALESSQKIFRKLHQICCILFVKVI